MHLLIYRSNYPLVHRSNDPSIDLSMNLSIHPSIYRSIYRSFYRSIDPSNDLSIHPSIYRSIDPSTHRLMLHLLAIVITFAGVITFTGDTVVKRTNNASSSHQPCQLFLASQKHSLAQRPRRFSPCWVKRLRSQYQSVPGG